MVKISVIMPLYNAAKYLEESLRSVLGQTFTDYEILCVNDASTDNTMEILKKFQNKDGRIRIISNQKNCGAAYSRNRGIQEARGEYLSFLDGDDIFDEEMLAAAYCAAVEHRADLVLLEPSRRFLSCQIYDKFVAFHSREYVDRYCGKLFSVQDHEPYEFMKWRTEPSDKLYRREFIECNKLAFQDLSCENDTYFVCMALMLSVRTIRINDTRMMVYKRNHDEPSRISYNRDPQCSYLAFLHLAQELMRRNRFAELCPYFYYRFYHTMKLALRLCRTKDKEQEFYQFLQEKGIDGIRFISGECYDGLDEYIKNSIEQFKSRGFESQWYREEEGLKMELNQPDNMRLVTELLTKYKRDNKKIGVWGVGANGSSFLKFCRGNNLHIDTVIDRAKEKQGGTVEGYLVEAPEHLEKKVQVLIITPRYIFQEISEKVAGFSIEVIDINQLLRVY